MSLGNYHQSVLLACVLFQVRKEKLMTPLLANVFHLQRGPLHSEKVWADREKKKKKKNLLFSLISYTLFTQFGEFCLWEIHLISVSYHRSVICFLFPLFKL